MHECAKCQKIDNHLFSVHHESIITEYGHENHLFYQDSDKREKIGNWKQILAF